MAKRDSMTSTKSQWPTSTSSLSYFHKAVANFEVMNRNFIFYSSVLNRCLDSQKSFLWFRRYEKQGRHFHAFWGFMSSAASAICKSHSAMWLTHSNLEYSVWSDHRRVVLHSRVDWKRNIMLQRKGPDMARIRMRNLQRPITCINRRQLGILPLLSCKRVQLDCVDVLATD